MCWRVGLYCCRQLVTTLSAFITFVSPCHGLSALIMTYHVDRRRSHNAHWKHKALLSSSAPVAKHTMAMQAAIDEVLRCSQLLLCLPLESD